MRCGMQAPREEVRGRDGRARVEGGGHHHLDGYRHGVERGAADDAHVVDGMKLVPVGRRGEGV